MQISYLLYDGSAYPKLTPPVSSPYQTTLSLSLSIYLSPSPLSHCIPLFATISLSFPPHPSFPFFLPPPPFFHPFSPTERSAVPRRLRSTRFSHPYLSSPPPIHISTAHTHTHIHVYILSLILVLAPARLPSLPTPFPLLHAAVHTACRTFGECFFRSL